MNRSYSRCWCAVLAGVLAAVPGVTIAVAAATWTVRPGGPVSISLKSGLLVLGDTAAGAVLTCTSARMSGTARDRIVAFTYTGHTAVLKTLTTGGNLHYYNVQQLRWVLPQRRPTRPQYHLHRQPQTSDHQPVTRTPGMA